MLSKTMISTPFGHEEPSIIADLEEFLQECSKLGFNTINIPDIDKLPKNSIIFTFTNDAAKKTFDIAKDTKNKKKHILCNASIRTHFRRSTIQLEPIINKRL